MSKQLINGVAPFLVTGLIGNIFNEGNSGLLQYSTVWSSIGLKGGEYITNYTQAQIVCTNTELGGGM